MKTNNEKWYDKQSGTSRDGKTNEKRDVKSILKGSRGAAKFTRPASDKPVGYRSEFNKQDEGNSYNSEKRPYSGNSYGEKRSYNSNNYGERRSYNSNNGERRSYDNNNNGERNSSYGENRENRPYNRERGDQSSFNNRRSYGNSDQRPSYGNRNNTGGGYRKPWEQNNNGDRPYNNRNQQQNGDRPTRLSLRKPGEDSRSEYSETRFDNRRPGVVFRKPTRKHDSDYNPNAKYSNKKQYEFSRNNVDLTKPVRLNKFLANAGICSRREADEYIQAGVISVNGEIVSELGVKVLPTDKILFHDQPVRSERKVYILLNKPKDCVTTAEDTHERLTVLDLVKNACSERIYPVGRLDRNTTGVLLLTNDGDLASKLTHPKYDKKKIYHATLDKPLERDDFESILSGVQLDDTTIAADSLEFVKDDDMKQIGIEIHSGQNRVVRRIFEKLGYKVIRLDRVFFAGLTKKNLPRGKYRFLSEREVNMLKMGAHE